MADAFQAYLSSRSHHTDDWLLKIILDVFHNTVGELADRNRSLPIDNVKLGNTHNLKTDEEMFSIYKILWDVSGMGIHTLEQERGLSVGQLCNSDYYNSLNEAVRASILNYLQSIA